MKLLLETTGEYGWSFRGVSSWGGNWHRRACNEALEQIRNKITSMVNLKELETFSKKNLTGGMNIEGASGSELKKKSSSLKIGGTYGRSEEEQFKMVKENYLLVDVKDVRIKSGTDWTHGDVNWKNEEKWSASATMLYQMRIFGDE